MVLLRFREVGRKFHCYVRFLTVTVNLLKNLMFTVLDNPPSRPSYKYFGFIIQSVLRSVVHVEQAKWPA